MEFIVEKVFHIKVKGRIAGNIVIMDIVCGMVLYYIGIVIIVIAIVKSCWQSSFLPEWKVFNQLIHSRTSSWLPLQHLIKATFSVQKLIRNNAQTLYTNWW